MNKPGATQLTTISTSQLTTIAGGVMDPIYRLPNPSNSHGGWSPPSYPPTQRPSTPPWAPFWPSHSGPPSSIPCHPVMPRFGGLLDQGQPTHQYYGV